MSFNRSDGSVQVGTMCDMVKHSFALSDWETSLERLVSNLR